MTRRIIAVSVAAVLATAAIRPVLAADGTPAVANHAAQSAAYASEAQALRQKAAEHELMLRRYENAGTSSTKGAPFPKAALVRHCRQLVAAYQKAAADAEALSKLESELAQAEPARN